MTSISIIDWLIDCMPSDHSDDEDRFITLGITATDKIVFLSHTDRGMVTRIISAREATKKSVKDIGEFPQFFSILVGDMSFVGPSPALFNQADLIALRTEKGVHRLTPGLTGWAPTLLSNRHF